MQFMHPVFESGSKNKKMSENNKNKVLLTWSHPWQEPVLEGVEIVQCPLTATKTVNCRDELTSLQTKFSDAVTCLLFFSKAGVEGFAGQDTSPPKQWRIAAIGQMTAKNLEKRGFKPDFVGQTTGLDMVKELVKSQYSPHFVMVSGDLGGEDVEAYLKANNVAHTRIKAYENYQPPGAQERLNELLPGLSLTCLASPSAARRLLENRDKSQISPLLSIGPVTSCQIRELGHEVAWEAETPGYKSFAEGIKKCLTK